MAQSTLARSEAPAAGITPAQRARRGLVVYFAVLIVLSAIIEGLMIGQKSMALAPVLMWVPALASIVARLALHEGFGDVSFRLGGRRTWRSIGKAFCYATVVGLVAYGLAWATGLVSFAAPTTGVGAMPAGRSPVAYFVVTLIIGNTLLTVVGMLTAAGEEIGWRGYMLTRLIDAGVPRPVLVSGLIWSLWHLPVLLAGIYAAGTYVGLSAVLFVLQATAAAFVAARLRLESGSIWPAIVFHGNWNAVIQGVFDRFSAGSFATLWAGESGILVVLAALLMAVALTRGPWQMWRRPPALAPDEQPVPVAHP
jgi:uncharacterized protein